MTKHILFTGGGSAGHVTPSIALIKKAQSCGFQVSYAGSARGIEHSLIEPLGVPYYALQSGKLARYFSWQTFLTPFKVCAGILQAYRLCRKLKPTVVFSKGGFVAVPVVIGAWLNRIPVIVHESDFSPGLANRLSYPYAKVVALSFEDSKHYFRHQKKLTVTGTPIREDILQGDAARGLAFLQFPEAKPILLIYAGGLGSIIINQTIRSIMTPLTAIFNVVHCCGKGKTDAQFEHIPGYRQFDYLNQELPDVLAAASLVVSRAGANSVYELLALHKPNLLIPLAKNASRGDQIDNANYCARLGLSKVLFQEALTPERLYADIETLFKERAAFTLRLEQYQLPDAVNHLMALIDSVALAAG